MDDRDKLLRLLSLVIWAEGDQCGLRFTDPEQEEQWRAIPAAWLEAKKRGQQPDAHPWDVAQELIHRVLERYAGALGHYRESASASYENSVDARELPGFTVEMVGQLPGDVQLMLGGMIRNSLGLTSADPARLVALWIDDVATTSWRMLLAERDDHHFGK